MKIINYNSLDDIFIPSILSRIFNINVSTVYNSCKTYNIPFYKVAKGCQRIYKYTDLWRLVEARWFKNYYENIKNIYSDNNASSIVATSELLRYQPTNEYAKNIYNPLMYELDEVITKKILPLAKDQLLKAIYVGLVPVIYSDSKFYIENEYCKKMRREEFDMFEVFRVN